MMKAYALLLFAGTLMLGSARATTALVPGVDDCKDMIAALAADVATVNIDGRNAERDRAGLLGKLNEAVAKLDLGKFSDAVQKMTDFQLKVRNMAGGAKPKLDSQDAARLDAAAQAIIDCIILL